MRNRVLAKHLLQVRLGCSRGYPAHPTAAQSHPTGSGQAVRSKERLVKCTNADNTNYLQRQKKIVAISDPLLPLHGNDAHRPRGCAPAPGGLRGLIHTQGKPNQHFRGKVSASWCWRTGQAWVWTYMQHTACCKPFLPSAPDPKSTQITPAACIFRRYLLEFFSFENSSSNAPQGWDSWLQMTAAGTSEGKPLQHSELHRAHHTSSKEQHAEPCDSWVTFLLKDTAADVYCTNSPRNINKILEIIPERNKLCAWICVNGQYKSAYNNICLTNQKLFI